MIKCVSIILLSYFIFGCRERRMPAIKEQPLLDSTNISPDTIPYVSKEELDTTILHMDSTIINKNMFTALYKKDTLYVIANNVDTIVKAPELHPNFEFADFNNDGYKDIRINYLSNVPAVQDLLLFDKKNNTFKLVENFSAYPDPKAIPGSKYYYSYHRSGCADMNWDSDLFFIKDFKTTRIGNISAYECENSDTTDGIYIYKIKGLQRSFVNTKPISVIYSYQDHKWGFIKSYWLKHYKKFL